MTLMFSTSMGPTRGWTIAPSIATVGTARPRTRSASARLFPIRETCSLDERIRYFNWMRDDVVLKFFREISR